jgi:hypothetical protein
VAGRRHHQQALVPLDGVTRCSSASWSARRVTSLDGAQNARDLIHRRHPAMPRLGRAMQCANPRCAVLMPAGSGDRVWGIRMHHQRRATFIVAAKARNGEPWESRGGMHVPRANTWRASGHIDRPNHGAAPLHTLAATKLKMQGCSPTPLRRSLRGQCWAEKTLKNGRILVGIKNLESRKTRKDGLVQSCVTPGRTKKGARLRSVRTSPGELPNEFVCPMVARRGYSGQLTWPPMC